jgi:hypothetical protein
LNFLWRSWPARSASAAAGIFLRNQLPMPSQQRFRRNDGSHFSKEAPAQQFRFRRQSATLVIAQTKLSTAQLLAQDAILLAEIVNDL